MMGVCVIGLISDMYVFHYFGCWYAALQSLAAYQQRPPLLEHYRLATNNCKIFFLISVVDTLCYNTLLHINVVNFSKRQKINNYFSKVSSKVILIPSFTFS